MNPPKFRLLKLTSKPARDSKPSRVTISDGSKIIHVYSYQGEDYSVNNIITKLNNDGILVTGISTYKNQTYLLINDDE